MAVAWSLLSRNASALRVRMSDMSIVNAIMILSVGLFYGGIVLFFDGPIWAGVMTSLLTAINLITGNKSWLK